MADSDTVTALAEAMRTADIRVGTFDYASQVVSTDFLVKVSLRSQDSDWIYTASMCKVGLAKAMRTANIQRYGFNFDNWERNLKDFTGSVSLRTQNPGYIPKGYMSKGNDLLHGATLTFYSDPEKTRPCKESSKYYTLKKENGRPESTDASLVDMVPIITAFAEYLETCLPEKHRAVSDENVSTDDNEDYIYEISTLSCRHTRHVDINVT